MSRYPRMKSGDKVFIRRGKEYFKVACCDCGLIHLMDVQLNRKKQFVLRFWRDSRSTAQIRRYNFGNLQQDRDTSWEMARKRR